MKKWCLVILLLPARWCRAQDPISAVISEGITKVIRAIDLKIQRLQNETIGWQNIQKRIENGMSRLKLTEIREWVERQRLLYQEYFVELYRVKAVLSYYYKVQEVIALQLRLVRDYKTAWGVVRRDRHFTAEEKAGIGGVYSRLLSASVKAVEGLDLVVQSFTTQMSDAARLDIIASALQQLQEIYHDLRQYTEQNKWLSLARAQDEKEIRVITQLYRLP